MQSAPTPTEQLPRARVVAFYLPQFHPIPENDEWWGTGFTEWTNVAKARRLFPGHAQPHIPADLGFYDLRVSETREAQAELARQYHVEAFCYWHYWFAGRRMLERPFTEMLATGRPDFPFCLAWANQTWTGTWHGAPDRVLLEQTYPGPEDDRRHFEHILPAFRDERYLRVDGKPLFYVFRPEQLPNPAVFVDRWQSMARDAGLDGLYLVAEISDLLGQGPSYTRVDEDGFDAGAYIRLPVDASPLAVLQMRLGRKLLRWPERFRYATTLPAPSTDLGIKTLHPCVYPNWDNSPRATRNGLVVTGSSPQQFQGHVRDALGRVAGGSRDEDLLFIKSWNEWAEGNYLEPDLEYGRGFLAALADELGSPDR